MKENMKQKEQLLYLKKNTYWRQLIKKRIAEVEEYINDINESCSKIIRKSLNSIINDSWDVKYNYNVIQFTDSLNSFQFQLVNSDTNSVMSPNTLKFIDTPNNYSYLNTNNLDKYIVLGKLLEYKPYMDVIYLEMLQAKEEIDRSINYIKRCQKIIYLHNSII